MKTGRPKTIQFGDCSDLAHAGSSRGREKWLDSRHILKVNKAYGDRYDVNVRERDDFRIWGLSFGKKRGRFQEPPAWDCGDEEFGCAYVELEMHIYFFTLL